MEKTSTRLEKLAGFISQMHFLRDTLSSFCKGKLDCIRRNETFEESEESSSRTLGDKRKDYP